MRTHKKGKCGLVHLREGGGGSVSGGGGGFAGGGSSLASTLMRAHSY